MPARRRPDTRGRLIAAAPAVFENHNYTDLSPADVAVQGEVARQNFYLHFSRKSEWAVEVLGIHLDRAAQEYEGRVEAAPPFTPYNRILGYLGLMDEVSANMPGITLALIEEKTELAGRHDIAGGYDLIIPRYHERLVAAFGEGQREGVLRSDLDPIPHADFAIASLAAGCASFLGDEGRESRAQFPRELMRGMEA